MPHDLQDHVIKGSLDFMGRSSSRWVTILPSLVIIDCCRDFSLLCYLARPHDQRVQQLYGWEPVKLTHHPARFGSHKHCGISALKEFVSLIMLAIEIEKKRDYFRYHSNSCKEEKILHQKHKSFTFELSLTKLSWLEKYKLTKDVAISKKYIFSMMVQKLKNIVTFHEYLPQLCS